MVHRVTRDGLRHSAPRANKIRQSIRCPWMHQNLRSTDAVINYGESDVYGRRAPRNSLLP
jgi:hypothetical protein